jgi:hypothetical protein
MINNIEQAGMACSMHDAAHFLDWLNLAMRSS